jgi:hypothetical protein
MRAGCSLVTVCGCFAHTPNALCVRAGKPLLVPYTRRSPGRTLATPINLLPVSGLPMSSLCRCFRGTAVPWSAAPSLLTARLW